MKNPTPDLSVVMPVFNEAGNLPVLHAELKAVLDRLGRSYEILAVDDGSTDGSLEVLRRLQKEDPHLRIIRFRRNFGQTAAFAAGFDHARGRVVITIDADGQNDPADIPRLLEVMEEGEYDIVSGWRQDRKEPFITRRFPSVVANRIISRTTGVRLHDYGCSLKAYRAEVVKNVHLYGELHRFIPALAGRMGVRVAEVPVNDRPRAYGKSKYGLSRTIRVLLDLFTVTYLLSFSSRPMQLFGLIGLGLGGLGGLVGLYLVGAKIAHGILEGAEGFRAYRIGTSPWLMLSVLLIVLGVQFIMMGLLGEVITRTYHEAQNKPIYAIREIIEPEEGE
ncbi:MAG TPA: glycosyltransferase [Anaerolineales bacterium]|nr:glycosyltransferase [Anaerolineales bacterium]